MIFQVKHKSDTATCYSDFVENRSVLAANLRLLMKKKGWTQVQLAKRCGLSQATISGLLTEQKSARGDTAELLADAFGVTMSSLYSPEALDTDIATQKVCKLMSSLDSDGKQAVLHTAEREAHFQELLK